MRGAQKAQPFGHPLDGRVRPWMTTPQSLRCHAARDELYCSGRGRATTLTLVGRRAEDYGRDLFLHEADGRGKA
jgi:hypothetical protein